MKWFYRSNLSSFACRAKRSGYGRGRSQNIRLATCSLQLEKFGNAATLPQQEKINSVGV
jgi:hypothetical protein